MRVHTRLEYDWSGEEIRLVSEEGYDYEGPVCELKGPSREEKDLLKSQTELAKKTAEFSDRQQELYNLLFEDYQKQFANQSAVLEAITKTWTPILEAGPTQEGFSPEEKTGFQTQILEESGANYDKAKKAVREALAARGGVPSGAVDVIEGQMASEAAKDAATRQSALAQASRERGYQNFLNAANVLGGAGAMYNPVGYAGTTTGAGGAVTSGYGTAGQIGSSAFDMAKTIKEQSGGVWGAVGGALGGALSSFGKGFGEAAGAGAFAAMCWVAAAIYGDGSPEFWAARRYIVYQWKGRTADIVRALYLRFGERVAKVVRKSRTLKFMLKPLFDVAVRRGA